MYSPTIILEAMINGLLTGGIYAMIALGLTLVYGVLHIINFAHGTMLAAAMFAVLGLNMLTGISPYASIVILAPVFFALGYGLQRYLIGPASHGDEGNILLITLGLSILIENALLAGFGSDTRAISSDFSFAIVEAGPFLISAPKLVGFIGSVVVSAGFWFLMNRTDAGKAIRAVAKEKFGASLMGIDVRHIYALTFGLGCAALAIAAGLLMPTFYVNPRVGGAFISIAFTIVVLGGMGSIPGALLGGLLIGVVESVSGLLLGESLGQIGIFLIFILVLLFRPTGLFGAKA
ncbi:MAG: branched-chain amino acid ABC transporter permease [Stappia sp.]|uniref:branched-chain amino acid ABC transporter permease n=1 Tax=Stappia sp. TaxID=1870903 RepID=UPI000C4E1AA0|nr:branched-chain amino acid ABC transporter permease [Stappia sp.]MAA96749.1 branched-chain amino acid ABC transporter permease [Stappia sp.]MBM21868.1 branched-chain amino acid ABC transporter permease [Stappia sp.]|tara:strand:- start:1359 stop:2231 length:873 start_codon:yes stop_codon:yes gene_type:complete